MKNKPKFKAKASPKAKAKAIGKLKKALQTKAPRNLTEV